MGVFKSIAAGLYRRGVQLRNWLYDMKILGSKQHDIPIVCVGNIAVGGTGKTPTVEFIFRNLSNEFKIAVLSRGYRRRTKGYLEVKANDSFLRVGDEPKQMKRKFPEVVVVVCENRNEGVRRIREEHPEVNLIVMDDGFQHRSITPKVCVILSDYSTPPFHNKMLPAGTLRDTPSQLYRADFLIITKTPENISPIERNIAQKELHPSPYQSIFFTDIKQGTPYPIFEDVAPCQIPLGSKVVAFAGIAHPDKFFDSIKEKYDVVETLSFKDHHAYRVKEIRKIAALVESLGESAYVITTEKDGVKLTSKKHIPESLQRRLFVQPIEINFRDDVDKLSQANEFITKLKKEIKKA